MSPPTIFSFGFLVFAETIAYCLLFNSGAIILRPDKYNKNIQNLLEEKVPYHVIRHNCFDKDLPHGLVYYNFVFQSLIFNGCHECPII